MWGFIGPISKLAFQEGVSPLEVAFWRALIAWGFFGLHAVVKKEVKAAFKNLYFDTAASPFLYDAKIYLLAKQIIGAEKILFGSDFPLLKPERYFKELEEAGLSTDDIKRICGTNAAQLLKI